MKRLTWLLVLALATGCSGNKGNQTKTSAGVGPFTVVGHRLQDFPR